MRALESITGHVIYDIAYTYKFQLKTTIIRKSSCIGNINLMLKIDDMCDCSCLCQNIFEFWQ